MTIQKLSRALILVISTIFLCQSCKEESTAPLNQPPIISSIVTNPTTSTSSRLEAAGIISIKVNATDGEGDELSYTWECTGGVFLEGQGTDSIKWQAPISPSATSFNITVNVSDGKETSKNSVQVYIDAAIFSTLSGYVYYTNTSIPIAGVLISIYNKNFTTSMDGYYSIDSILNGNRLLKAEKAGFEIFQSTISIDSASKYQVIKLSSQQYTHKVYGQIKTSLVQQPLIGVHVVLQNNDGSQSEIETYSDANGNYEITGVPEGLRKIEYGKYNFKSNISELQILNSDIQNNIELYKYPAIPNDPIPADNSLNLPYYVILNWKNSDSSDTQIKYDIYLDESDPPMNKVGENLEWTTIRAYFLKINTLYYWKIVAKSSTGEITEGPVWKFKTKQYNTVQIGTQVFLKQNVDIGVMIDGDQQATDNGIVEKYCYDDDPNNCITYGAFYQWNEVMNYSTTPGTQGICPEGWHIPTRAEYEILKAAVNHSSNSLKAVGQGTGAGTGSNTSGFSALLTGRNYGPGYFDRLGFTTYYWMSSVIQDWAHYLLLSEANNIIQIPQEDKNFGHCLRCIQNE